MKTILALVALSVTLTGCASSNTAAGSKKLVAAANAHDKSLMIDQVKSLAGTWQVLNDKGEPESESTFAVASGGSAVREVMFVGTPHEMTNMYHMDGSSLILTHYCAMGNQPKMRATPATSSNGKVAFKFDSVTNYTDSKGECMAEMTLTIKDKDHIHQDWFSEKNGVKQPPFGFDLRRKS